MAREKGLPFATDDRLAIRACKVLGISFLTAIHFLIGLRKKNKLTKNKGQAILEKLKYYGRYREDIISDARRRI